MLKAHASPLGRSLAPTSDWILVLASQTSLRELLLQVLGLAGYTALGSATLRQAEPSLFAWGQPTLIVLDDAGTTETALAERVQQVADLLSPAAPCPILVLSAMHPLPRARSLPGQALVVSKPFDLAAVLRLVASQTTPGERGRAAAGALGMPGTGDQLETESCSAKGGCGPDQVAADRTGRRTCWLACPPPTSGRALLAPDTEDAR